MIWYDMIWYDMIWYDMIWYDMIWYDMIWYDMIWYDMIWYDRYDMIWYDMIDMILTCRKQEDTSERIGDKAAASNRTDTIVCCSRVSQVNIQCCHKFFHVVDLVHNPAKDGDFPTHVLVVHSFQKLLICFCGSISRLDTTTTWVKDNRPV